MYECGAEVLVVSTSGVKGVKGAVGDFQWELVPQLFGLVWSGVPRVRVSVTVGTI